MLEVPWLEVYSCSFPEITILWGPLDTCFQSLNYHSFPRRSRPCLELHSVLSVSPVNRILGVQRPIHFVRSLCISHQTGGVSTNIMFLKKYICSHMNPTEVHSIRYELYPSLHLASAETALKHLWKNQCFIKLFSETTSWIFLRF